MCINICRGDSSRGLSILRGGNECIRVHTVYMLYNRTDNANNNDKNNNNKNKNNTLRAYIYMIFSY